jgi:hypothetical protein
MLQRLLRGRQLGALMSARVLPSAYAAGIVLRRLRRRRRQIGKWSAAGHKSCLRYSRRWNLKGSAPLWPVERVRGGALTEFRWNKFKAINWLGQQPVVRDAEINDCIYLRYLYLYQLLSLIPVYANSLLGDRPASCRLAAI